VVGRPPLVLPRAVHDEVVAHARAALPNEGCGILAGRDGRVDRFYPAESSNPSPVFFTLEGAELMRIFTAIGEAYGLDDPEDAMLAIYHSHVSSPAFPSRSDVERAMWPDSAYLIVSLGVDPPEVKAYDIAEGRISRREVVVEP
jgi:proteasome lid subunit RPN8/RPN11